MNTDKCYVTKNMASPRLQPTGPTADISAMVSMSLHDIASRSVLHFPQSPRPNSFLQSALETSMRKVIPDVLNNLSQGNRRSTPDEQDSDREICGSKKHDLRFGSAAYLVIRD